MRDHIAQSRRIEAGLETRCSEAPKSYVQTPNKPSVPHRLTKLRGGCNGRFFRLSAIVSPHRVGLDPDHHLTGSIQFPS